MPQLKGNLLTVPYSHTGSAAIETNPYQLNNKVYEVGLASLFLYITGGTSPPATVAITHQFRMDRESAYYGISNNVLNDSDVNTLALSAGTDAKFEANLNNRSWWKFSRFGGRIIITPSGAGDFIIKVVEVCGI